MCADGKIDGVTKFGNAWAIPIDAEKPTDNRVVSGKYKNWRKKYEEVKENETEVQKKHKFRWRISSKS